MRALSWKSQRRPDDRVPGQLAPMPEGMGPIGADNPFLLVLYAIGVYLLSLEPPTNPNPLPVNLANLGEQVFAARSAALVIRRRTTRPSS